MRVDVVAPGPFWTILQHAAESAQPAVGARARLHFLATQDASYVTGEVYGGNGIA